MRFYWNMHVMCAAHPRRSEFIRERAGAPATDVLIEMPPSRINSVLQRVVSAYRKLVSGRHPMRRSQPQRDPPLKVIARGFQGAVDKADVAAFVLKFELGRG